MKNDSSPCCFSAADILLPTFQNFETWAVIACDQFTSQPEYWQRVDEITSSHYSAAHLILPESELGGDDTNRIHQIHENMLRYLQEDVFRCYPDCYVYTERMLADGSIRCGIIGKVDLEAYDYTGSVNAQIRATEQTVKERIPPRMDIRRNAALELPHILLLCDDDRKCLIEPFALNKKRLPQLYGFDLMLGGGHISGWLIEGKEKSALDQRFIAYSKAQRKKRPGMELLFAVGDGNHSLATAKACFEELKKNNPGIDFSKHPARYALCELNNIHDAAQRFEPIHRIIKCCDTDLLIHDFENSFPSKVGVEVSWLCSNRAGTVHMPCSDQQLPVSLLQDFLDGWLNSHPGEIDYIHGCDTLKSLCTEPGSVGFLLPRMDKDRLFPGILSNGVLPRKTFSMGRAEEKRYYLEARRIQ